MRLIKRKSVKQNPNKNPKAQKQKTKNKNRRNGKIAEYKKEKACKKNASSKLKKKPPEKTEIK